MHPKSSRADPESPSVVPRRRLPGVHADVGPAPASAPISTAYHVTEPSGPALSSPCLPLSCLSKPSTNGLSCMSRPYPSLASPVLTIPEDGQKTLTPGSTNHWRTSRPRTSTVLGHPYSVRERKNSGLYSRPISPSPPPWTSPPRLPLRPIPSPEVITPLSWQTPRALYPGGIASRIRR